MSFSLRQLDDLTVIYYKIDCVFQNILDLKSSIIPLLKKVKTSKFLLDFSDTKMIDSSCIGSLALLCKITMEMNSRMSVILYRDDYLMEKMNQMGLNRFMGIYDSGEEAIKAFNYPACMYGITKAAIKQMA